MTLAPASSHGSTFNGGTITTPLEVAIPKSLQTIMLGTLTDALDWKAQIYSADNGANDVDVVMVLQPHANGEIVVSWGDDNLNGLFRYQSEGALEVYPRNGVTTPSFTGYGAALSPITSGALPTVAPVSGAAFQCSTTRDVFLTVPVTYNPGVATTATCKVELSPDNVTFSELVTVTQPVGTVFDGSIEAVQLIVPAAWRVKLTVVNATLGTGTYY